MDNVNASQLIERLKVIEAEETIIRSKVNEQLDTLSKEREQIKTTLKDYYYSLPKENLEETKTLRYIKFGDSKLQEKIQDPEYIRNDDELLNSLVNYGLDEFIKIIPEKKQADWAALKKEIKVVDGRVLYGEFDYEIQGVALKERDPIFEVVIK